MPSYGGTKWFLLLALVAPPGLVACGDDTGPSSAPDASMGTGGSSGSGGSGGSGGGSVGMCNEVCNGVSFSCDGPEDCSGGNGICCGAPVGASAGSACTARCNLQQSELCHNSQDYPAARSHCCSLGPYSFCFAQL